MSNEQPSEPSTQSRSQQSRWRGRIEVLLLVIGALVLVITTAFIFLAGAE